MGIALTSGFQSRIRRKRREARDMEVFNGDRIKTARLQTTSVRVPKTGKTGFPPAIIFFLCKNPVKRAIARPSIRSGTIVRVRLKFVLNQHWNQHFYYANFASTIDFYGNFMVTLTMVPDRFESRATAHITGFLQRKQMIAGGKPVLADFGTLTCVLSIYTPSLN